MLYAGVAGSTAIDLAHATVAKSKQLTAYLAASSLSQQHLRRLAAADWSYTALTPRKLAASIDIEAASCPLTLERYADLRQALVWLQGQVCKVYEAEIFITYWVKEGIDATTRQRLSLDVRIRPK